GADLGGQLALTDAGWRGEFNLHGRNLSLRRSEDFTLQYQPDLTLQIEPDRLHLIGTLVLQKGFVWIKELPEGSVGTSDDVVFVDETGAPETTRSSHAVTADVMVSVQDKLRLRGFGGDVRLSGQVRVRQDATGVATGRGTIDIVEGSYTGFGQQLKIRKGQIIFSGPLDQPYISLEAIREVDTVVAGLRVSGPASEPIATLFSEPAMADSEVLYYIVTGKEPGTGTKEDNTLVQNTLLSMSLMGDRPRMRNLASKVGIEDLQMGTAGTGESTEVLLSGYLSPRTYLQYGISLFEPVNTLTVRYELRDNLFLEAVSGLASALDLLYSFEF
ncbi:MAG: translocation/assembly module TamB domain-containing protein, partial [Pseudomonadota bacterium]